MIKNNNCNTNQTPKCKPNTDAVQIMADQSKIDGTLTDIQTVIDSLKSALSDYCTEEGTNLDAISTKLSTVEITTTVEPTTTEEITTTEQVTTT